MEDGLGLLGGGGGALSGGSTNGSTSTVTKAEVVEQDYYMGFSSEVSSYNPEPAEAEAELELGLGLGLGGVVKVKPSSCRILTAKDFTSSMVSHGSSASSSSPSSRANVSSAIAITGTKRAADSIVQEVGSSNGVSQVVGWPPIRTYRINSLVNQATVSVPEGNNIVTENGKGKDNTKKTNTIKNNNCNVKENGCAGNSLFVKVNMDGVPIGRKVDLNAHACYETLAQTLEDMFHGPTTAINSIRSSEEKEHVVDSALPSKLLDGSSEFVLTYEDKEGDWMLVGDVPWGMFLVTVKRLRIMRTSEVNRLAPRFEHSGERQRKKPI